MSATVSVPASVPVSASVSLFVYFCICTVVVFLSALLCARVYMSIWLSSSSSFAQLLSLFQCLSLCPFVPLSLLCYSAAYISVGSAILLSVIFCLCACACIYFCSVSSFLCASLCISSPVSIALFIFLSIVFCTKQLVQSVALRCSALSCLYCFVYNFGIHNKTGR